MQPFRVCIAGAAVLAGMSAGAAAASSTGSLYGFAIRSTTQKGAERVSIANIDIATGIATYTPKIDSYASDAFCNVAFASSGQGTSGGPAYLSPAYAPHDLSPSGMAYQTLLTIDAASGAVLRNVTLSSLFALPATTWDPASSSVLALGIPPAGGARLLSIDPSTGNVTVVQASLNIPDIQLCEAVFSADASVDLSTLTMTGTMFYLFQPLANNTPEMLVTYDLGKNAVVQSVPYNAGLNSLTLMPGSTPTAPTSLLSVSFYDTRPIELITIDPATGKSSVLATLPDEFYSPYQGALALNGAADTAYSVFIYTNQTTGTAYDILLSFDLTTTPATMVSHVLNETSAEDGIWSLDWA
jgi:hypothetical protein